MNRRNFLLTLLLLAAACFADSTFFTQNFDNIWTTTSPPTGWTIFYQAPAGPEDWHRDSANTYWPSNHTGYAKISLISKLGNPTNPIIDSLISPIVDCSRFRNIMLRCTSFIRHRQNNYSAKIIGSIDGGVTYPYSIAEFYGHYDDTILPVKTFNLNWAQEQENIRIAFVFIGQIIDIDFWCLDNISLTGEYVFDTDVASHLILKPLNIQPPSLCTVKVRIINLGKSNLTNVMVRCSLYNWIGTPLAYADAVVAELNYRETLDVDLQDAYYFPNLPGFYKAKAWCEVSGDQNPFNDTIEKDFSIAWSQILYHTNEDLHAGKSFPIREQGWGTKLTPFYYPVLINHVQCYLGFSNAVKPYRYKIRIVDDNGPNGTPGTTLYETPNYTDSICEWKTIYLFNEELYIDSGSVYVFYIQVDDAPNAPLLYHDRERNPAVSYYKYYYNSYLPDYPSGDWLIRMLVRYPQRYVYDHDLRVVFISEPIDEFVRRPLNLQIPIKARIENIGNYDQNSFTVSCTIRSYNTGSFRKGFTTPNLSLAAGRDTFIEFYPWKITYNEPVQISVRINLPTDQQPANNHKTSIVENKTGIFTYREETFSYAWCDSDTSNGPIYNWYNTNNAFLITNIGDDTMIPVQPLRFYFPYYESTYNRIYVSTNGFLTFTTGQSSSPENTLIPSSGNPNNILSIFWDDLILPDNRSAQIYYEPFGDSLCVITWSNIARKNTDYSQRLNFQVLLYRNGEIYFQYKDVYCNDQSADNGKSASIGIENIDGTIGLQYLLGTDSVINNWPENKLSANRVIKFYKQIRDVGVTAIIAPTDTIIPRPTTPYVRIKNHGTETEDTISVHLSITNTPYDTCLSVFNMMPKDERTIQFPDWNAYVGNYLLTCSTSLNVDQRQENNSKTKSVLVSNWILKPYIPVNSENRKVKNGAMVYATDFNKIFVLKGGTNEFWCYNIAANRWESLPRIPLLPSGKHPKAGCALTFGQGRKIYAIKGGGKTDFYVYDIIDSTWTSLAPMKDTMQNTKPPKDGAGLAYCNYDGLIYAIAGNNTHYVLRYVPGDPPHGNYWRYLDRLPDIPYIVNKIQHGASIHAVDSILYIFNGNKSRDLHRYDITTNSWFEERCTIPGVKNVVSAGGTASYFPITQTIYFFLGGNKQALWKYNTTNNTFDSISSIPLGPRRKKIKTGASIVTAGTDDPLFVLKGGSTTEFWAYAHWSTKEKHSNQQSNPKKQASDEISLPKTITTTSAHSPLTINYTLHQTSYVTLKLYTITGRLIETLVSQEQIPGDYTVNLTNFRKNNKPLKGIYFIKGSIGTSPISKKIIIL